MLNIAKVYFLGLADTYIYQFKTDSHSQPWSMAIFSFQSIASYRKYTMEKLAGDLLLGSEFIKLPIPPKQFI